MKKIIIPIGLTASILLTSCLGSFQFTNSALDWNKNATNNKFTNNLLFFGLTLTQFYTVTLIVDAVFLNLLEYWNGDSPLSMEEGEIQQQKIKKDGKIYQITASKNKFELLVLKGENKGEKLDLQYTESDQSWNAIMENGESVKLASWKDGFYYVHSENNEDIILDGSINLQEGIQKLKALGEDHYCFQ